MKATSDDKTDTPADNKTLAYLFLIRELESIFWDENFCKKRYLLIRKIFIESCYMFLNSDPKISRFSGYTRRSLSNYKRVNSKTERVQLPIKDSVMVRNKINALIKSDVDFVKRRDWFKALKKSDQQEIIDRHYQKYET